MSSRRADVTERIESYRRACEGREVNAVLAATRSALGDRHYLLVARAAELTGERSLYDLEPDLIGAYRRFLVDPVKRDPNCTAKGAIARALVALDCQEVDFYLAGIGYQQFEPVWGGSIDTAVDLRVSCAAGLAATGYPRALIEFATMLQDPEPHARSGAVRAIACTEPLAAEAVLRCKALAGDVEPEVMADCLAALLELAPEDALDFVAAFIDGEDATLAELAALVLGQSHLDAAIPLLRARWEAQPFKRDADRVLLRAAALHRSEAAFAWLLEVVARGDHASAELVISELAAYRANDRLRERLEAGLIERADPRLSVCFREAFGIGAAGR